LVETIQDTNVDLERRVIYLFDDIDSKSAKMTIQSLDFLNKTDGLVYLHISTPGGVWVDGMAVFSAIRLSRNNVVGIIYGDCSSMGSVILQACKTRIATTECEMLIHPGTSSGTADSISFVNRGKHEEKILDKMYRIYWDRIPAEKKMKLSYEKFKKMFSHDIFLDSDQALKYGLVDEVR
jgi:ATP-dependent Clp endopeptidase proteolytic subunit ClpP